MFLRILQNFLRRTKSYWPALHSQSLSALLSGLGPQLHGSKSTHCSQPGVTSVLSSLFQFPQIFQTAWRALSAGCCTHRTSFYLVVTSGGKQAQSLWNFFVSISLVVALWGWVLPWLISNWIKLLLNHKSVMYVSLKLLLWKGRSQDSESELLRSEFVFSCDPWAS